MNQAPFWTPSPETISNAQVTILAEGLGLTSFDAFYAFSLSHPDAYWRHINDALNIVWSRPYERYVDLSEGAPFPRWFVGGELNWTDTVLAWADHPDHREQAALIGETEAGEREILTFTGLREQVNRFAAGLSAAGVQRGDRVGLLMEPCIEAIVSFLAINYIGAVAVPLFSGFGLDAVVSRLAACGATALITTAGFIRRGRRVDIASVMREALTHLPDIGTVFLKRRAGDTIWIERARDWHETALHPPGPPAARMDPNDPMMIVYTSGTTGKPKGAVHTHGGFPIKIAHDSAIHFDVAPGDVWCWPVDIGWIAGSLTIAAALMRGATYVCYDGAPDMPDWSRMSRLVEAHRVTHLGAAPTLIRGLAANEAQAALGSLKTVRILITAGEVIDAEHMLWYHRVMGRGECPVINYTGGTEVSGSLLASVVVRPIVAASFNAITPGIDLDILDEAGNPVTGVPGELTIRQPFVGMTQAFWQDRARYLETYWQQVPGVWTHGDLALRVDNQTFFILGRSDDTLKIAGKRVGPAEVEDILQQLPQVAEVAAIGVQDAVKGQSLVVFVVPTPGLNTPHADLERLVAATVTEGLGKPFQPSRVHIVSLLPRTRSQKIMRRVIRRVYTGADPGDLSSLDNPAAIDEVRLAAT